MDVAKLTAFFAVALALFALVPAPANESTRMEQAAGRVSLAAAEILHQRLNDEFFTSGMVAIYEGALSWRAGPGVVPAFSPGRWRVIPYTKAFDMDGYNPRLAKETDVLFRLQITDARSEKTINLRVNGEKVGISVLGVPHDWPLPHLVDSHGQAKTVREILERCGDRDAGRETR